MAHTSLVRLTELTSKIWHVTLNRPSQHNAFNTDLAKSLIKTCSLISEAEKDGSLTKNAVIISGEGRSFCSGADLKERQFIKTTDRWMDQHRIFEQMFHSIQQLKVPTIACVEGFALAGGFELALNCDMIVASRTSFFGLSEVTRGIMPGGGGTQLLARLIGPSRAKLISMTGHQLTGQEAFDMGIVQCLTEDGKALNKAIEIANTISANAPLAIRAIKEAIDQGWGKSMEQAKIVELDCYTRLIGTEDRQEGIRAFNEKRKPIWKGC